MYISGLNISYYRKNSFSVVQQGPTYHEKVLNVLSVVQSVRGSYGFGTGKGPLRNTGEGGFFIAPAMARQRIRQDPEPLTGLMCCRWVFIEIRVNDSYTLDQLYDFPSVVTGTDAADLNVIFEDIFAADNIFDEYSCCFRLARVLTAMGTPKKDPGNEFVLKTVKYIEDNLSSEISVSDLADNVCMSVSGFHAAFRKNFELSPIKYVNNMRLSAAADYLLNSGLPVGAVGEAVGLTDPFYFSRAFKKLYGMSPKQYRESSRGK